MNFLLKSLFLVCLFGILGCSEIAPDVSAPLSSGGGEPDIVLKNVLIEEFTGVTCVNCPNGSLKIEDFIATNDDGRIIAVSIHAGPFSIPFGPSKYDFRTVIGNDLTNFLGAPIGYPSAVINRTEFEEGGGLQSSQNSWAGYISGELNEEAKVKISSNHTFNDGKLDLAIDFDVLEDVEGEIKFSVMITESNIIDAQLTESGINKDYVHKHVLRDMLTAYSGNELGNSLSKGEKITKSLSYTFNSSWDSDNCKIIIFAHQSGVSNEILQVIEKHL